MRVRLAEILDAAVARLDAGRLAAGAVPRSVEAPWLLALGKVAGPLAAGAARGAGGSVGRVVVVTGKDGRPGPPGAETYLGEHPVPGPGSFAAGRALLEAARDARLAGVKVGVLVSGGASALCEAPAAGLLPEDLSRVHRLLVASGAPIDEVNLVRRHLSAIKGGGLARALGPSLAFVRVLADVPSGRPEEVGSGPAIPQAARFAGALRVIEARGLRGRVPARVLAHLEAGVSGGAGVSEAADITGAAGASARDVSVLASPQTLAQTAAALARDLGPVHLRGAVSGVSAAALAEEVAAFLAGGEGVWIATGEVSVTVPEGAPPGGRARHLALEVLARAPAGGRWAFLAAGSDGLDGTGAAGAVVDSALAAQIPKDEIHGALRRFAAGPFHDRHGTALPPSPPVTNLTDLYLAWRVG